MVIHKFFYTTLLFFLFCVGMFFYFSTTDDGGEVVEHNKDVFTTEVSPRLHNTQNDFSLQEHSSLFPSAHAQESLNSASSYIAIDFDTGEVILEKSKDERLPIASVTKIMTAVVALDLAEEDEHFMVSEHAAGIIPTKIGVVSGEEMTASELLHALLLTSANDAAEVIREGVDEKYGEDVFIRAMNEKAEFLGLENTSFDNPQGFDGEKNYSTTHDLAILTHYALNHYPLISEIVQKDYAFLPENAHHKQFDLYNWNGLVGVYPNVFGVKIGSTGRAGKTTVVGAERAGERVLVVLLGAPGILERDQWSAELLDEAFYQSMGLSKINVSELDLHAKYGTWQYF